MNKKVIGITGYAGTGKDVLCEMLIKYINSLPDQKAMRFSFADILKEELREVILKHGIDTVECSREDKEKIRDTLVAYGLFIRQQTNGRYLVEKVQEKIEKSDCTHAIISDIRYQQYPTDEGHWLLNEVNGKIIVLNRYNFKTNAIGTSDYDYIKPANIYEEENRKKIEELLQVKPDDTRHIFLTWASFDIAPFSREAWEKRMEVYYNKYFIDFN